MVASVPQNFARVRGGTRSTRRRALGVTRSPWGQASKLLRGLGDSPRCFFDPYGKRTVLTASGTPSSSGALTRYGYTGREHDAVISTLVYFRSRYFSTKLGRFLSDDDGYRDGWSLPCGYFAMWGVMDPSGKNGMSNWDIFWEEYKKEFGEVVRTETMILCGPTGCSQAPNPPTVPKPLPTSGDEPKFDPTIWNDPTKTDKTHRQYRNNCYSYSCDNDDPKRPYKTKPQPGDTSGVPCKAVTCADVKASAVADGLVEIDCDKPCAKGSYKVALVVDPKVDYHWYRQDSGGLWSHKPGLTPATNVDANGKQIIDPRTAGRDYSPNGPNYKDFCACFCVKVKVAP